MDILLNNIYLSKLNNNKLSIEDFSKSFSNFINCVNYWSQILGLLVYKLDNWYDRKIIIENLCDENAINNELSHTDTFKKFIINLNHSYDFSDNYASSVFNEMLLNYSNLDLSIFISTLGFIEFYYQNISSIILKYLKNNNINNNNHYSEHEILDNKHSKDLFNILYNKYSSDLVSNILKYGSNNAIILFDTYFNNIYTLVKDTHCE